MIGRIFYVSFVVAIMLSSCANKTDKNILPSWINNPLKNCSDGYMCAVGEGNSVLSSSANARNELAKQFSVNIKSDNVFSITQENDKDTTKAFAVVNENVDDIISGLFGGLLQIATSLLNKTVRMKSISQTRRIVTKKKLPSDFGMLFQVSQVFPDQFDPLTDAVGAAERVLGGVEHIVAQAAHVGGGHVHPRIGGGVVDVHPPVVVRDDAVGKDDVAHVADSLAAQGAQ